LEKNTQRVLSGIIMILLIVPAMGAVNIASNGQEMEDQTVTRIENDQYETEWEIDIDNDGIEYVWSADEPTDNQVINETSATETDNWTITANTETQVVYPIAPWLASLLKFMIPLVLVGGALYQFSKVGEGRKEGDLSHQYHKSRLGEKAQGSFAELISMVIGVVFSTVLAVKLIPVLNGIVAEMESTLYGFVYLIELVPVLLVIGIFYKMYKEYF